MSRRIATLAALVIAAASALAADIPRTAIDVPAWRERLAETKRLCEADAESDACAIAARASQSDLSRAVTAIGYARDRDRVRPIVRRFLDLDPPGLQTAAAYALARLTPEPADTPRLVALLNSRVPTVRRAAWGALKASPDPDVREWVARAQYQGRGERWINDIRATDAETLQVEAPPGTTPVWFEMEAWRLGVLVFTTDGDPGSVITHFSNISGQGSRALADAAEWFASGEVAKKAYDRFANAAWFQTPYVVPLALDAAGKPTRVAVVWHDILFNRTGFALQWVPAETMPLFRTAPWSGWEELALKLPEGAVEPAHTGPSFDKEGADPLDTDSYMAVVLGDGTGADAYLATFPNGAYRAEVEALKAQPRVWAAESDLREPTSITIRYANMPVGEPVHFDVIAQSTLASLLDSADSPGPIKPVTIPEGSRDGEIVWTPDQPLGEGLYEIRVFIGKQEMEFDAWSQRRTMPAEEAVIFHTIRILPRLVAITLNREVYAPGELVTISYEGMPAKGEPNVATPYITIVKADAGRTAWQQYKYADAGDGALELEAPRTPGAYQARVRFSDDSGIHGVADFTVDAAVEPLTRAPTPEATPTPAPTPEAVDANVVITLDKPSFAPNEPITGRVTGLSGDRDWIAIVPAGAEDGTTGHWVYAEKGAKESAFTLPGQAAGSYEIRVRFRDQYRPVKQRLPIEIK